MPYTRTRKHIMPSLHVCPLSRLEETVETLGASHVVSLVNAGTPMTRPAAISPDNHLFLAMNDIAEVQPGMTAPGEHHVKALIEFVCEWDRKAPLVFHCYAGISRSTAGAYISALALRPEEDEEALAARLRAASPSATPNPRLIALADSILGRNGRMIRAIAAIGRGEEAFEGVPFLLPMTFKGPSFRD